MPILTQAFVVAHQGSPFELREVVLDDPGPGEVCVKITACGICLTDIHAQNGIFPSPYPCVLGHEGAGEVIAVGPAVSRVRIGDSVLLSFASCDACKFCNSGCPASCVRWMDLNFGRMRSNGSTTTSITADGEERVHGSFFGQSALARHAVVSESSAVVISTGHDLVQLAPLGCGMQTGSGAVFNVLKPERPETSSLVIFGAGAVGMAALFAATSLGFESIIVVDLVPARLSLALEFGAMHGLLGDRSDLTSHIRSLTTTGADYVIEATGVMPCIQAGWEVLGPRGKMVQVGSPGEGHTANIPIHEAVCSSKTYHCMNQGDSNPRDFLPKLIAMHGAGQFPVDKISRAFSYRDLEDAIEAQHNGTTIKAVIVFD